VAELDGRRGAYFSSNYEVPGRYTRWDTAVLDPPLGIQSHGRRLWIEAIYLWLWPF
jgi:anthranilate synthase